MHRNMVFIYRVRKGVWGKCGKKGKEVVKEHVCMTHGRGQQEGDGLWERGIEWSRGGQRGKISTTMIE